MAAAGELPKELELPKPKFLREEQQDAYLRKIEIDPTKYTPTDVKRDLVTHLPPIKINLDDALKRKKDGQ